MSYRKRACIDSGQGRGIQLESRDVVVRRHREDAQRDGDLAEICRVPTAHL